MKKILSILIFSFFSVFVFADTFRVKILQNVEVQYDIGEPFIDVEKGSELTVDTYKTSIYFTDEGGISLSAKIGDAYYDLDDNLIEFENHSLSIPKELQRSYWIMDYYFEMLKNKDINILLKNEPYYNSEEEYVYNDRDELIPWQRNFYILYIKFGKYLIKSSNPIKFDGMGFISFPISFDDNVLQLEVPTLNYQKMYETANIWKKVTELKTPLKLFLKNDGDYLYVYKNSIAENNLLYTLIRGNEKTCEQIYNFVKNNSFEESSVTWPRHADGSCDFDGSKTAVATQTANSEVSTNVTKNKTMTVSENLKLRSSEATSTQVLTVMSAGTKVKILELGKSEIIDGISSNWVKVEVLSNAKDRDGKPIKKGTVGWCYGGYLK